MSAPRLGRACCGRRARFVIRPGLDAATNAAAPGGGSGGSGSGGGRFTPPHPTSGADDADERKPPAGNPSAGPASQVYATVKEVGAVALGCSSILFSLSRLVFVTKGEFKAELKELRGDFKADMKELRDDLKADMKGLTAVVTQMGMDIVRLDTNLTAKRKP